MQSQYVSLFHLPQNLFSPGAPMMVVSGTLLQHSQTGQLFAQLIMENLGPNPIVSMKLELTGLDPADRPLTMGMEHFIMDINAPRGGQFGSNYMFPMPHPAVRAFTFRISEIIFADKTIWNGDECMWNPLPPSRTLEATLGDEELAKQYRIEYGNTCQYAPVMLEEVYLCSCGGVNRHQYACAHCGASPSALSDTLITSLREKADLRLEQEAQAAEEERRLEAERQKQREEEKARKAEELQRKKEELAAAWAKRKKKIIRTAILIPVCLVVIFALLVVTHFWILPEINYNLALNSIKKGDYENAYRLFNILEDYRDSEDYLARFALRTTLEETTNESVRSSLYDYEDEGSNRVYSGTRYEYKYDRGGHTTWSQRTSLTMENGRYVPTGEPEIDDEWSTYTYNSAGNPIEKIGIDGNRTVFTYTSSGKLGKEEVYDEDDELLGEYLYSYDSSGNRTKLQYYFDGDLSSETTCTYNSAGNVTKLQTENLADETTAIHTYEYDKQNRITKYIYKYTDHDNAENSTSRTTKYTYTITGKLASEETKSTSDWETSYNYTYNLFNQLVEYEYSYNAKSYRVKQTYSISYNVLGHISNVEGVYKYMDKDDDRSYTRKESAEVTCRLDGTMKEVHLSEKYSGDTSEYDRKHTIQYNSAEAITSKKTVYDNERVTEVEYEYTYFYFPEGTLTPSEY